MKSRFLPQLNFSNVVAAIALFVALGGAAVAAGLPKGSVGPRQLKRGAVTAAAIRKQAVTSGKLAPRAVTAGKLGPNSVMPGNIGNGAVTTAKIGGSAVIAASIKNNVVTTNKLNNKAVTSAKLADGAVSSSSLQANAVGNTNIANEAVTPNKLSKEFGPIIGTLRSGQTLRGTFAIGATPGEDSKLASTLSGQSFQSPLTATPAVTVMAPGTTNAACGGLGNGGATPAAAGGNLCVYVTSTTNVKALAAAANGTNRLGFALEATAEDPTKAFSAYGQWAVTAP